MKSTLFVISLSIGCGACSSMPWTTPPPEVDRELVAAVPPAQSQGIDDARSARDEASDAYDVAKRNKALVEDQLSLAKKELDLAKAEEETAQAAAEMAEKGSTEDLEKAKEALHDAKPVVLAAETRIQWREMDLDCARMREELARQRLVLGDARVELARAEAVKALDQPAAKDVEVDDYQRAVRNQEKSVALAAIDVDAAELEARIAQDKYMNSAKAVPASYRNRTESIDAEIEFETDGYEAGQLDRDGQN